MGARPLKEGTGRISRFELIPLEELGRPRVDVLCNMSGIFRDSFQNVIDLLDDLFQMAASVDEPENMNFVRKHSAAMRSQVQHRVTLVIIAAAAVAAAAAAVTINLSLLLFC